MEIHECQYFIFIKQIEITLKEFETTQICIDKITFNLITMLI